MKIDDWDDLDIVAEIDENGKGLSRWETFFIDSMVNQLTHSSQKLTEKDHAKLVEIARERCEVVE